MEPLEQAFLAQVQADAADRTSRLIYADWLEDRDDSRAEFVRLLAAPPAPETRQRLSQLRPPIDPLWLVAIGDTPARLESIAQLLDVRKGRRALRDAQLLTWGYQPVARPPTSCLTVWREGPLLDLAVSASAIDPKWNGDLEEDLQNSPEGVLDVGTLLAGPEIAPAVRSLYLWATDAANGVSEISLDGLASGSGRFENLTRFGTNFRSDHGECILVTRASGRIYEEGGVLAKLLAKCPVVEEMALASAPNHEFFSAGPRPLRLLDVKAGNDHQSFIANLSRSTCFPQLRVLRYEELLADDAVTGCDEYIELLRSPAMRGVETVELHCPWFGKAEVRRLRAVRKHGLTIRGRASK